MKRSGVVIAGAVVASVVATTVPAVASPVSGPGSSTNAQGSVRSSFKATPGNVGGNTADAGGGSSVNSGADGPGTGVSSASGTTQGLTAPGNKATPQTRVPAANRASKSETPNPGSSVSAQQTTARHDRDGQLKVESSHSPARSSVTQIVARDNDDGSRTVSDQHGSSTFRHKVAKLLTSTPPPSSAPEQAPAPPPQAPGQEAPVSSGDTWTIVVGGFGDTEGTVFTNANAEGVDAVVKYSAALTGASTREGVDELNRMIREHRAANPGQHIKVVGYSQGAAVVHTWTAENAGTIDNVNSVLIADPKRQGGPGTGTDGLSGQWYAGVVGTPTAGSDQNFGTIPTTSVCTDDVICDSSAPSGWIGYASQPSAHGNYSFNVDDYADNANGQWFNGEFKPWG
ncbi:hypothetical protein K378_02558 [Streptomyces sp. Amel2xB2]|nr:hypothetical protein K378_02558 [Streptomyces sp. Amel2xB2]